VKSVSAKYTIWTETSFGKLWKISGESDHARVFEVHMKEYNLLTKKLIEEGYSADNHPSYVFLGINGNDKNPLDNWDGGFIYVRMYAEKIVYKTGCGKFVMGKTCLDNFGTMGWNGHTRTTIQCSDVHMISQIAK
jgi:hypothetical protein